MTNNDYSFLNELTQGIPLSPLPPPITHLDPSVPHAPKRPLPLNNDEKKIAVRNALRYFPSSLHEVLAPEFAEELEKYGHIYMYRFRPRYEMKAYPVNAYPAKCVQARCIQLMIQNNLDPRVAQYPHELITYGGNGAVFQNWAQYHLVMQYLSMMREDETLVIYSGHPLGLFPSTPDAPRVILTNGMVVPQYSSRELFDKMYALGVTQYGQMTAGSYCYIGPQGIVHGTTLTIMNAALKYLGTTDLRGKVFVSSGLGGMSGAQAKAGVIAGLVAVIAEVDERAITKRLQQGWVKEVYRDIDQVIRRIREARANKESTSIAYHGNVVTLWEKLASLDENLVDLGSDQTSLHNPFNGGYYPVQLTFEEANVMMNTNPTEFKRLVQESLRRQVAAINTLAARGMKFWDYGNSFLLEASNANADIYVPVPHFFITTLCDLFNQRVVVFIHFDLQGSNKGKLRYPSYVEDIMADIFSLGFGPFRWVCTSGDPEDLRKTDIVAKQICEELAAENCNTLSYPQYVANAKWVTEALQHNLVVGSQARILYSDLEGRIRLAVAMNEMVRSGTLRGPVVISRDHHDVSGTDSPWRETMDLRHKDLSHYTADMSVHNFVGDAVRGADWVALHNGGGTGWGQAINGGFGLVLDGSSSAQTRAMRMLFWDVANGLTRRAWAGNSNALNTLQRVLQRYPSPSLVIDRSASLEPALHLTLPNFCDPHLLDSLFK